MHSASKYQENSLEITVLQQLVDFHQVSLKGQVKKDLFTATPYG